MGEAAEARREKGPRVLVLCDFAADGPEAIPDHALALSRYTDFEVFHYDPYVSEFPSWLELDVFRVVVIHYSVYILGDSHLAPSWVERLRETTALKVLFIQDEYRNVNRFKDRFLQLGIDQIFTMVPPDSWEYMYPEAELPDLRKVHTYAGYSPTHFEETPPDLDRKRSRDVGYRARGTGLWWLGKLFQEKRLIGEGFQERAAGTELVCDISLREEDRIYGPAWLEFLGDSRFTLGSETGSSVIDFDGSVERNVTRFCEENPGGTFEEAQERFFADLEGIVRWRSLSPRVFEAAGMGTCQILFEGDYAGAMKPGLHYIELKKDFSNFDEVLAVMQDEEKVREICQRAYQDLIASGEFSYRTFARRAEAEIRKALEETGKGAVSGPAAPFPRWLQAMIPGWLRPVSRAIRLAATPIRYLGYLIDEYLLGALRLGHALLHLLVFQDRSWALRGYRRGKLGLVHRLMRFRRLAPFLRREENRLFWRCLLGWELFSHPALPEGRKSA